MDGPLLTEVELFFDSIDSFSSFLEHHKEEKGIDPLLKDDYAYNAFYHLMRRVRFDAYSVFNLVDWIDSTTTSPKG